MTDEQKRVRRLYDRLRKFCERVDVEVAVLKALFPTISDKTISGNPYGDSLRDELGRVVWDLESACVRAKNAVGLASDYAIRRRGQ